MNQLGDASVLEKIKSVRTYGIWDFFCSFPTEIFNLKEERKTESM